MALLLQCSLSLLLLLSPFSPAVLEVEPTVLQAAPIVVKLKAQN